MSAIDDMLNIGQDDDLVTGMFDLIPDAKFELSALRASAAEAATLRAERDELKREYDEEVAEFNAGFEAYRSGIHYDDEPHDTKYDQWRCGWAWAAFDVLRATVAEQARQIEAARELLTTLDWNDWSDKVDAWLAANAPTQIEKDHDGK